MLVGSSSTRGVLTEMRATLIPRVFRLRVALVPRVVRLRSTMVHTTITHHTAIGTEASPVTRKSK
jgi:hypothetical protein